mgnify:CR=1 FL=1
MKKVILYVATVCSALCMNSCSDYLDKNPLNSPSDQTFLATETEMQMALASLMGQAFHLLSPLVAFIYLLLRLTGLDMGAWQKESAKYALGIFVIFLVTIVLFGQMPLYIPQ